MIYVGVIVKKKYKYAFDSFSVDLYICNVEPDRSFLKSYASLLSLFLVKEYLIWTTVHCFNGHLAVHPKINTKKLYSIF